MNRDRDRSRIFSRRIALLAGAKVALLSTLVGRMYYLQVVENNRYTTLAEENRIDPRLLPPPRGRILDRFGVPLAVNQPYYSVTVTPEQTVKVESVIESLGRLIRVSAEDRANALRRVKTQPRYIPAIVREDLTWEELAAVEVNLPDLPGVAIDAGLRRSYPYGALAGHVIGYVAEASGEEAEIDPLLKMPGFRIGKLGLEKAYDARLRGKPGTSEMEVNAGGRAIRELSRVEPEAGQDLRVTLDIGLQNFTAQCLSPENSAAAVVMDVRSGDILAIASSPAFDPNPFVNGISHDLWTSLVEDAYQPLMDKAIGGQYAPGSTFKMMVALAALESGVATPDETVFCSGVMRLGDAKFHCWKRGGHGTLDLVGAIKNSCDVYFYELALRAGLDAIVAMARRFGLGQTHDLGIVGERHGFLPTKDWKFATFGTPWQKGETVVTGIGQGFVTTTALQLAVMTARLASGGLAVKPRLVRPEMPRTPGETGSGATAESLGLQQRWLDVVLEAMSRVVNDPGGTGYKARITEPGLEMAGKSGTSQVRRISTAERRTGVRKNEDIPWEERDHALFVGFAPVHRPRYAAAVIVQHGGSGSATAGPIVRDVLLEAQRRWSGEDLLHDHLIAGTSDQKST